MSQWGAAQIVNGTDTLYGLEWIRPGQRYFKLKISADDLYRVDAASLQTAGWPISDVAGQNIHLWHQGQSVPIFVSSANAWTAGDYLVFRGEKNRGELDRHLFSQPDEQQLNPQHSMYSDTAVYFLTWNTEVNPNIIQLVDNELNNAPAAETYIWRTASVVNSNQYLKEYYRFSGSTLYYSHYSIGEGYGSRNINQLQADGSTTQNVNLSLQNPYAEGPDFRLKTRYAAALFEHNQKLTLNDVPIRQDTFYNWLLLNVDTLLPASLLQGNTARLNWEGTAGAKDEVSVGFASMEYPALPRAGSATRQQFALRATSGSQYLALQGYQGGQAVVYDFANLEKRNAVMAGTELQVHFNPYLGGQRSIFIAPDDASLPSLTPAEAQITLPSLDAPDYIILTNSLLRQGNTDPVQAYAEYRASQAGGGYRTAVIDVESLFDVFGYGIPWHPLAVRNFVAWQRSVNPDFRYLFIIGKGREYIDLRTGANLSGALGSTLFVPSFGYPASDNLMVSDIGNSVPNVHVGRLAAISPAEVATYLQKITELEAQINTPHGIDNRSWMKNMLHLGGGTTISEQLSIKLRLENMADEVEGGQMGADVTSYYKTSTDPIQSSVTDEIFDRINKGVSMLTFFGHSSAGNFDFSIDNPFNYNNAGKYPVMVSLGCYAGNAFENFRSIGERFIELEDGGAIAFAASSGLGFVHALGDFGKTLHQLLADDMYGATLGEVITATLATYSTRTDQAFGTLNEQFALQGDPAIRLFPLQGHDYTFDPATAKITPPVVNLQQDSFLLELDLYNLGRRQNDSIDIQITQVLPSGQVRDMGTFTFPTPGLVERIGITLPTLGRISLGQNTLLVRCDPANKLSELPLPIAEANNDYIRNNGETGLPFFVVNNAATPSWPPKYALVGTPPTLVASTGDALAQEQKYVFQLDTTARFNSPSLQRHELSSSGGLLNWQPATAWLDSTTYYWRIAPDSTATEGSYIWEEASFTYVAGSPFGWALQHHDQWIEALNDEGMPYVEAERRFDYAQDNRDMTIKNRVWDALDPPGFIYNNQGLAGSVVPWSYTDAGLSILVGLPRQAQYVRNTGLQYGSLDPANRPVFTFPTATVEQRQAIVDFLENVVPDAHYVYLFTVLKTASSDLHTEDWAADTLLYNNSIFKVLEAQGAGLASYLHNLGSVPYNLMYIKNRGVQAEDIAQSLDDVVLTSSNFPLSSEAGSLYSDKLGPAKAWQQLNWRFEESLPDTLFSQLIGINELGEETLLLDSIYAPSTDISNISATDYPYLRLGLVGKSSAFRTPPQLDYWHLNYTPYPEIGLAANEFLYFYKDTLEQGEIMQLSAAVRNIGLTTSDTLQLKYRVALPNGEEQSSEIQRSPLASSDTLHLRFQFDTKAVSGDHLLSVEISHPEQAFENNPANNFLSLPFHVRQDAVAPVIQVAFDGRRIYNRDLVAPKPEVSITLRDENNYLLLRDSSLLTLSVIAPSGQETPIIPANYRVEYYPATDLADNELQVLWYPEFEEDGTYKLIAKGKDNASNNSGSVAYEVEFEVVTRKAIANVLPYPNPFTTSTQFVYTVTGEAPSFFKIQILTISGRIVREITQAEFGALQIGTHRSDFVWDGTDQYGDALANGVYFYRVIAQDADGNAYEKYDTGTDAYFENGVGKIVIIR